MIIPDEIVSRQSIALKDKFFDLRGLSAYSSLGVSTLRDHIKKGLPSFKIGGKVLIKLSEFDRWLERYRVKQDLNAIADDAVNQVKTKSE